MHLYPMVVSVQQEPDVEDETSSLTAENTKEKLSEEKTLPEY